MFEQRADSFGRPHLIVLQSGVTQEMPNAQVTYLSPFALIQDLANVFHPCGQYCWVEQISFLRTRNLAGRMEQIIGHACAGLLVFAQLARSFVRRPIDQTNQFYKELRVYRQLMVQGFERALLVSEERQEGPFDLCQPDCIYSCCLLEILQQLLNLIAEELINRGVERGISRLLKDAHDELCVWQHLPHIVSDHIQGTPWPPMDEQLFSGTKTVSRILDQIRELSPVEADCVLAQAFETIPCLSSARQIQKEIRPLFRCLERAVRTQSLVSPCPPTCPETSRHVVFCYTAALGIR